MNGSMDDVESSLKIAMGLVMENKIYPAIKIYEDILASHPDHVATHIQLGLLQYKLCAVSEGNKHMEAALKARPALEERRLIEKTLKEQKELNKGRYIRPDFEALSRANRNRSGQSWMKSFMASLRRIFK